MVGATSGTTTAATVSPATRTFMPSNWNTPQTFTVRGVDVGSSTITHAVTSSTDPKYPTNLSISSVTATVTVSPGITLSSTAVGVIDGSTEAYTVKLNTAPTADVTITPTSGTTGVATVSPSTLTFTLDELEHGAGGHHHGRDGGHVDDHARGPRARTRTTARP